MKNRPFILMILILLFHSSCIKMKSKIIRIRFTRMGPASALKYMEKQVEEFEKRNPCIKVDFNIVTKGYMKKILIEIKGGSPPDVFYVPMGAAQRLIKNNYIMSLDEFIKKDQIKLNDFYQQVLHPYLFKDEIYAVPDTHSPLVMYYNKELFDEAGVPYPEDNWTWEDFLKKAYALTKINKNNIIEQYGFVGWSAGISWYMGIFHLIHQNCGRYFTTDEKKCIINSPQNIETLNYLRDLIYKYRVMPKLMEMKGVTGTVKPSGLFLSRRAALYAQGRWFVVDLRKNPNLKYGIVPLPARKCKGNTIDSKGLAIPHNAEHPEEAWKFIQFMTSYEGQKITCLSGDGVPSLKPLALSDDFLNNKEFPREIRNELFLKELGNTVMRPNIMSELPDMGDLFRDQLDLFFMKKQSAETTLINIEKEGNKLLKDFQQEIKK